MDAGKHADKISLELARELRARREGLHLSMNEVATRAGLAVSFIGYLETGQRKPSVETLSRLATAFGCRAFEILEAAERKAGGRS